MRRMAMAVVVVLATGGLMAEEHPKEHPTGGPASGKQAGPSQQGAPSGSDSGIESGWMRGRAQGVAAEGSKAWLDQIRKEYEAKVWEAGKGGSKTQSYRIHDDKLGREWDLRVVKVHADRIVALGGGKFFACSDFKSVKNGETDKLDLDFFATRTANGGWTIDKALIHKVNGRPRYTWSEKNEMVPVAD